MQLCRVLDQSTINTPMDLLASRIIMEMVIEQGGNLRDILKVVRVMVKGRDPISALVESGNIPQF